MRGKVIARKGVKIHERDHPRLCGEKPGFSPRIRLKSGSPPPMRGKVFTFHFSYARFGITPAYAGKRRHPVHHGREPWDHPRLCGEKCGVVFIEQQRGGSPPPMRGKVHDYREHERGLGITPAYAGKSLEKRMTFVLILDHPRLCGEKQEDEITRGIEEGSPPPMRGKANGNYTRKGDARITPAYAGKRFRAVVVFPTPPDHPRLCGEKRL